MKTDFRQMICLDGRCTELVQDQIEWKVLALTGLNLRVLLPQYTLTNKIMLFLSFIRNSGGEGIKPTSHSVSPWLKSRYKYRLS